jgi:hypothetical protein
LRSAARHLVDDALQMVDKRCRSVRTADRWHI